jgi:hypothetical protein
MVLTGSNEPGETYAIRKALNKLTELDMPKTIAIT